MEVDRVSFREMPLGTGRSEMATGWEEPSQRSTGPTGTRRRPMGSTMERSRGLRRKVTS